MIFIALQQDSMNVQANIDFVTNALSGSVHRLLQASVPIVYRLFANFLEEVAATYAEVREGTYS